MTGFRVSAHRTWRDMPERPSSARPGPEQAEPEAAKPDPFYRSLLFLPAWLHDRLFGRLQSRRPLFLVTRFALVLLAVVLVLQGVSGSAQPVLEVGDYKRVTEPTAVQSYLAPGSTHKYPINVAVGQGTGVSAFFTQTRAEVRLPTMANNGNAYGLQLGVEHNQRDMDVVMMVAQPGEGFRSVPMERRAQSLTQFETIRFADAGEYGVMVRSTNGVGPANILVSVVEAPVEAQNPFSLDWLPLVSGMALGTVLMGPYLPGANRQAKRPPRKRGARASRPQVMMAHSFAHIRPTLQGVRIDGGQGAGPDALAAQHDRGWVIRNE